MDDVVPPYSILCKIIFHDIDIYISVCEKGNPFCRLVCIDCRRHDLLTVVYEDLCAEPVKDHPQFQFTVFTVHQTPALMDDRSSGTRKLSAVWYVSS